MPSKWKWLLLLMASCWFYISFIPYYIFVLGLTIFIDYFAAIFIERSVGKSRKLWLVISVLSTVSVLFVFKYFNFFIHNLNQLSGFLGWNYSVGILSLALPIGLSFHTFQSLSYVIEVYKGRYKAEKHFGIYSLYVMFYPQLVAGPIERPQHLLPQLKLAHHFDWENLRSGLLRMLWGFIKKMVIADRLALYVNQVFAEPTHHAGLNSWLAVYFFSIQIYCDFSGYSDIAIGAAKVMGINLAENFNLPYFSLTLAEFWKRWHISLSTWFRDYVYIPLGGSRVVYVRFLVNILLTFFLSGFWHGANWTFIIWGIFHGILLILEKALYPKKNLSKSILSWFVNFNIICLLWIFFRADTISNAELMFRNLLSSAPLHTPFSMAYETIEDMVTLGVFVPLLFILEGIYGNSPLLKLSVSKPLLWRWGVAWCAAFLLLSFAVFKNPQTFIYFQF